MDSPPAKKDFFISRNGADSDWARWIATELEDTGYTTILQDWDFRPGQNFISRMQDAITQSERTIAVLSQQYLNAEFTQPEWMAAFRQDPKGDKGLLIPIRVQECEPPGLLASLAYIDVFGIEEEEALQRLLQGLERGRAKRKQAFPGGPAAPPKPKQRFPGTLPEIFNIPHQRNPNFTGRDELLRQLREALGGGESAAITQAIHGLGGVGKTQLALEYVYRYANEYPLIWWVRSEGPESLNADFEALGKKLGVVPKEERSEQSEVVEAVRGDLEQRTGWLLVFDNARKPDESVRFLLARTGHTDEAAARELAEELGRLPLALAQAAAYMERTGRTMAGYLDLFRHWKLELFQAGVPGSDENATVTTTWEISFQEIAQEHPAAAGLMNLCAFLAPDDIPMKIIVDGAEHLPDELAAAVQDPLELDKAVMALRDYSLVEGGSETPEERGLSMHRLVQAVTRERLSEEDQKIWAGLAVSVVNSAFPDEANDVRTWLRCAKLGAHAVQAAGHAEARDIALEAAGRLLNQLGEYSYGRADLDQAKTHFERALAIDERVHGPEHPNVAIRTNNIGTILQAQGDLAGALEHMRRALAIDEKIRGPEHPAVAVRVNNIGTILQAQGDLAGALEYTKRALAIGEKVHGPEHPSVAIRVNNIGQILKDQGDLAGALEYTKRALAIGEKVHGPEHPSVAVLANNIGQILKDQGDLAGALEYTKRALAIDEKVYGLEHPDVAIRVNNIGQILHDQGDLAGALEYTKRALAIGEKVHGPEHPNVAIRVNNIGAILTEQGDLTGALEYTKRALAIDEKVYGPEHPSVAIWINNIGQILKAQGDLAGALEYTQRALAIDEKVYGPEHPTVATVANNIATILRDQGDLAGARSHFERALRIFQKFLGDDHPNTQTVQRHLEGLGG